MITLYTTNCPHCKGLEAMLNSRPYIHYEKIECTPEFMSAQGWSSSPILKVDEVAMTFFEAQNWVKNAR